MGGTWNNLTMRERAGFIKIGVDNGLTSLTDIKNAYNKFAQGGAFGNKQVRKFDDGGEEKKYEVTQGYPIVGDPEYVDNDVIQRDQYGNLLNPYTGGYGPARVPEVEVVGYGNGRAYYTNPDDRRLAELIRDKNRRKEAYRQIYGTDEGFYMSPFAISDKPLKTVSPEFDLITMGGMGKDILKVGKNLFKLRKMPVSYTGVPKEFVADFMEYEPRDFYTKESKKVVKELAEKGITPEDQNIFTIALDHRAPKSNNWGRERGATFEWELSPDKQKIVGYKGDNTSIYTSDNINIAKSHLNNSPEGKIFKIYDKGTGKEFHIKSPKEEFGISDHPYYGEPWYEWDNIPITVDPYTQEIVKIPIDNWEFGKVVPTYRPYTPQTTSSLMSNLRNLGYSQLRTDRVNMNYPGYQYPITERIYTTAKDIIKAPLEEPMWQTALRTSNINLPYTVANATLGAGNVLYDYTKALGGHIYDGETEDSQQVETTKPSIAQRIKLGLANLDNEVLGRILLTGQALLDPNPDKRADAKYGLTHGKEDLGEGNDIYYLNGLPQSTFLLPEWERQILFENAGWHRLPNGSYNLVNKAASKHGRALPTYQTGPDAIDRSELTALGNLLTDFPIVKGDHELPDAGSRPSTFYIGSDNKIYVKEEDLNDYSNIGLLGRALDLIGHPLVVTTGIQPYIYGGKPMDLQSIYEHHSPVANLMENYMNKQGLHAEKINGRWQFVGPDVVITPNGYAWGGNLYDKGGGPLYLPEDTGNETLDKVMKVANIVGDFVPVLGSARSIQTAVQDPSLANIGSAILNVVGDLSGFGAISKIGRAAIMYNRARKVKQAQDTYELARSKAAIQRAATALYGSDKETKAVQKALNRSTKEAKKAKTLVAARAKQPISVKNIHNAERVTSAASTVETGISDIKTL